MAGVLCRYFISFAMKGLFPKSRATERKVLSWTFNLHELYLEGYLRHGICSVLLHGSILNPVLFLVVHQTEMGV